MKGYPDAYMAITRLELDQLGKNAIESAHFELSKLGLIYAA